MAPLFLGLDSSTQALKASLLASDLSVLSEVEVRFDVDLAHHGTRGGTLQGEAGSGVVFSPVMLIVEAMDLLFERIKAAQWPVHDVRGVSAAGQQHASVYWSHQANAILADVDASKPLSNQLAPAFSRKEVPNWQDSSTSAECSLLEERLGGAASLARRTGSRAHTRFTGPQIMRFMATEPDAYRQTARISLVSSFVTTLLCLDGEVKGIDESDACGMNMWRMDTPQRGWDHAALEAIAGGSEPAAVLEAKLGHVESDGGRVVGRIGRWFVERYGFSSECIVCPGTGDNPATFLAFTLGQGEGLVSLGTSDTVLVATSAYNPDPQYHAFFHPAQIVEPAGDEAQGKAGDRDPMRYFNMLVYKNGSLAREHIRDTYFASSWDDFNEAVEKSRPRNEQDRPSQAAFWWLKPEIIPANASGVHKYAGDKQVDEFASPATNAIAILESQMLSYRSRASAILGGEADARLKRVFASGGAASNAVICSVMADVLGCNVCKPVQYRPDEGRWGNVHWNACSVAAAYKAAWAWNRHTADDDRRWKRFDDFVKACSQERQHHRRQGPGGDPTSAPAGLELLEEGVAVVARPDEGRAGAYKASVEWWKALEARAVCEGGM